MEERLYQMMRLRHAVTPLVCEQFWERVCSLVLCPVTVIFTIRHTGADEQSSQLCQSENGFMTIHVYLL